MNNQFATFNLHLTEPDRFAEVDPHLVQLREQPYVYHHPILAELPRTVSGIYTLGGGRQIGKTTLLKQWIEQLLSAGIAPNHIRFYTGELIDDHHTLVNLLQHDQQETHDADMVYIIIDEVTYIDQWDRGIKFAADAGLLKSAVLILTGSDLTMIQSARMTFPGRRGMADKVDYHIYSLNFKEFITLKYPNTKLSTPEIFAEFQAYCQHGGFLTAINDIAKNNKISAATLRTYSDWIRGDMLKRGKQDVYLREILQAIIKSYNKQVSWRSLADNLSIDSNQTVADYCELLASMDALFIQRALLEDKLVGAPKKAKKLTFTDPFIYHAIKYWLNPTLDPYVKIQQDCRDPIISADLVEAIVSNHYRQRYPTYYLKTSGEIDIAYIKDHKFWPIEIKWRNQLRPSDVKLIKKYPRAHIFSKIQTTSVIDDIPITPLPLALMTLFD